MARIVAGLGLSHVPSVGVAYDRGKMQTPPMTTGMGLITFEDDQPRAT